MAISRTSIFDVRDRDNFYWPYSGHHPGHIPDIAEGRAMGLDPGSASGEWGELDEGVEIGYTIR